MADHVFTEGEKKCMEEYWAKASKTPRKNLIKLVKHINAFNLNPSEKSWEYILFDRMLSDEMVDALLKLKLRKPYYIIQCAALWNMSTFEAAKFADDMARIGIIEYTSDDSGVDMIQIPVFAPGAMENTVMEKWRTDMYPETAPAFLNYVLDLQKLVTNVVPMGSALMRAIPVEESIKSEPKKVKYEELSYWLDKAGDSIGVAPCECRKLRRMVGEGTHDLEGDFCINLGKYAESCIRTGKARRISRQEAETILKRAEELGYVHQLSNIDGPDFSLFICNCRWDTCMALKTSWYSSSPAMAASNYTAKVDKEKCVACGGCVEVCPQNALKLGRRLCEKTPTEVPKAITAEDTMFLNPKKWPRNSFLTNRENVVKETGTAPCKSSCPAHIAVQGYLKKAAQGDYDTALAIIKKENPFPAMCGRVCARFCEQECTRGEIDSPVAIDEVKKFIADREIKAENRYIPKKEYTEGHKIAVIGAGPAGLSCAYYLAVYGHEVTVFEKEDRPGGMMVYGMPSFRLEKDVVDAEIDVIKQLGVEIKTGVEVGKDITLDELRAQGFRGFYIAIGAQGGRKLNIVGEDAQGVIPGIDFLREIAKDNGTKLSGKTIVIGGGNVACDVARSTVREGAEETAMYCLESRAEMPADKDEIAEAEEEGITVNCGWGPKEILTENGRVTGVVFRKCISVRDEKGRFSPKYDENDTITVEADFVIPAVGQSIEWGDMLRGSKVQLNRNNTAKADSWTYQTAEADVFVGGDAYTGPRFAIDAIAAGKEGADSLHRYVHEGHSLILGRVRRDNFTQLDKENTVFECYDNAQRQKVNKDETKHLTKADDRLTFTEEQVKAETARCLGCGAAVLDPGLCIGCGLCTTRCKFDAISLSRTKDDWGVPYEKLVPHILKTNVQKAKRLAKKDR